VSNERSDRLANVVERANQVRSADHARLEPKLTKLVQRASNER